MELGNGRLESGREESPRLGENTVHVGLWGLSLPLTMRGQADVVSDWLSCFIYNSQSLRTWVVPTLPAMARGCGLGPEKRMQTSLELGESSRLHITSLWGPHPS